jgi:C1A family cysteine protease
MDMQSSVTDYGHGLGWKPALPDIRNHRLIIEAYMSVRGILPRTVDLRTNMPPIGDQGPLGSCTAWAALAAYRYEMVKAGLPDMDLSELAQYYWSRLIEHSTRIDSGATITDAIKVLAKVGAAPEKAWPYSTQRSKWVHAPSRAVRALAKQHLAIEYQAVPQVLVSLRGVLAIGYPVVFGISVYESFESEKVATTGVVDMPNTSESLLGGHALVLVGYDDSVRLFIVRNSWGTDFGDAGYVYLPYEYVTSSDLASDFWIIKRAG